MLTNNNPENQEAELTILEPHERQYKFISSKAKFRAFIGGVGSGKTVIGCAEMIEYMSNNPGSLNVVAAPTYRMLSDVTRRTFFDLCEKGHVYYQFFKADNRAVFENKAEVLFRSTEDPEKLRGPTIASFYGDEASLWDKAAWNILIARLRQSGYPLKAWITATPKGFGWIYEQWVKNPKQGYELITCMSTENPYLPPDYVETLKDAYSGLFFRQEVLGEFVAPKGVVYHQFTRPTHVRSAKGKKFKEFIYGVDWGYNNPSVLLAIGVTADQQLYVVEEFYKRKASIEEHIEIAKEFQENHGDGTFYADPSEPQFIQKFHEAGIDCIGAKNEIRPGINKVGSFLEKKMESGEPALLVDPSCVHTIMELEQYSYALAKEGKPEHDKPLKVHDHAMDALRYACMSFGAGEFRLLEKLGKLFDSDMENDYVHPRHRHL